MTVTEVCFLAYAQYLVDFMEGKGRGYCEGEGDEYGTGKGGR